ncbi:uncharacterized protein LOC132546691 [Ylistrum balloti]|uniref:uncharacterized protein LOC132546691 n=1 Tax=Ylistrum balloti TaxID=509963 RepID=UPI002905D0E9|nr:uncharacterized protein LOC132546691 [Ylistrum balloti]
MDIRLFLLFVVMLSVMHQGPGIYQGLVCVEPEPGYVQRFYHYLTASEFEKVCPTSVDVAMRIGNEVLCTLLCALVSLLLRNAPAVGRRVRKGYSTMMSMIHEWRTRPSRCPHCGTVPCQVKRRSLWKPSGSRKRDKANFAERAKAMKLFNYGLELSVVLTKELPRDDLYWRRKFCHQFEEKHMVLFPLCIQRQINYWYPVPR